MKPQTHIPALDGLRGVAILMVILTHAAQRWYGAAAIYRLPGGEAGSFIIPWKLELIARHAANGVQLFFVVSAFTLTLSLMKHDSGLGRYALRRIARVGPGYWLAGLVYMLLAGFAPRLQAPAGIAATDVAVAAMFGSAWQLGPSLAVVPGGWSVACEVAFYVALPVVLRVVDGRLWRAVALTAAAILASQLRVGHLIDAGAGFGVPQVFAPLHQAPTFMLGVTSCLVATRLPLPAFRGLAVALLVMAVVGLPMLRFDERLLLPTTAFAVLASAVVALAAVHPPTILASRAARRIGEVSYSMYLVHFGLLGISLAAAERLSPAGDWMTLALHFCLTAAGSYLIATLTYRFVEQPAVRWSHRRQGAAAPAMRNADEATVRSAGR